MEGPGPALGGGSRGRRVRVTPVPGAAPPEAAAGTETAPWEKAAGSAAGEDGAGAAARGWGIGAEGPGSNGRARPAPQPRRAKRETAQGPLAQEAGGHRAPSPALAGPGSARLRGDRRCRLPQAPASQSPTSSPLAPGAASQPVPVPRGRFPRPVPAARGLDPLAGAGAAPQQPGQRQLQVPGSTTRSLRGTAAGALGPAQHDDGWYRFGAASPSVHSPHCAPRNK